MADLTCREQSMSVGRIHRLLLVVSWVRLLIGPPSPVAAEDSFTLSNVAAICERTPTAFPFQGGDCVPAEGAVIVVTTDVGTLVGTCIAVPEEAGSLIASCSVDVPFGTVVLVTEDVATITPGYAPESNPQRFEVPSGPPDGPFGGPVFVNLPLTDDGTPDAVVPTPTHTPTSLSSACDADPLPTPTPDTSLALPGYGVVFDGDSATSSLGPSVTGP